MSIFDTTANTRGNAFADPMNPMNMNGGGWGMNPNYLTPSYDAPYRPPYTGTGQTMPYPNPSLGRSMYGAAFGQTPYGVGSFNQDSRYWDAMDSKPNDAVAYGAQRFATPFVMWGGAIAIERAWRMRNISPLAGSLMGGAATVSGFTGMGQRAGAGLARGLIGGAEMFFPGVSAGRAAATMTGAAKFVGGAAGFAMGTAGVAQLGIAAADKFAFEPYVGARENQNVIRGAFSGISFPGQGDPYSGRGISRGDAARIGGQLGAFGMKDPTFNSREVASITSMAAQGGLLDNVNPDQITSRMTSLIRQLKTVMSVTGTTDFKEAVSMMAKLQMAGTSPGNIGSTMTQIGALSSAAGISANRMMNTVGAQGQYLFQANGLTPYLGQLAAANSMAGFATAFRTGLVGPELMARMGGVEGATQTSVTGQLNASQTMYNMMRNYNRYNTGIGGVGVNQNVSNFGVSVARDPVGTMGLFALSKGKNLSRQFDEEGIMGTHNQVVDLARPLGLMRNGKLRAQDAAAVMQGMMGMNPEEIQAYMAQYAAYKNPSTRNQLEAGIRSQQIVQQRDYMERMGQTFLSDKVAPIVTAYRDVRGGITRGIGRALGVSGDLTDAFSAGWNKLQYGDLSQTQGVTTGSLKKMGDSRLVDEDYLDSVAAAPRSKTGGHPYAMIGRDKEQEDWNKTVGDIKHSNTRDHVAAAKTLNRLWMAGDQDAIVALGNGPGAADARLRLVDKGKLDKSYGDIAKFKGLSEFLSSSKRKSDSGFENIKGKYFQGLEAIGKLMTEGSGAIEQQEMASVISRLDKASQEGTYVTSSEDPSIKADIAYLRSKSKEGFRDESEFRAVKNKYLSVMNEGNISGQELFGGPKGAMEAAAKAGSFQASVLGKKMSESEDFILQTPSSKYKGVGTPEEQREMIRQNEALNGQLQNIHSAAKNGLIDITTEYQMTAGLVMDRAANIMLQASQNMMKASGKEVTVGNETAPTSAPGTEAVTGRTVLLRPR